MSLFVAEATIVVVATTYALLDTSSSTDSDSENDSNNTAANPSTSTLPTSACSTCTAPLPAYYSFEWTSSIGLLYSCILLYILLSTTANAIAAWKFWTVWNAVHKERTRHCCCSLREEPVAHPQDCPICWCATGATACVCPKCRKGFHKGCLQQWVATGTVACPWCRGSLVNDVTKEKQWGWPW